MTTNQLVLEEDCQNAVPSRFEAMIADPPYSAHVHRHATSQSKKGGARHRDLGFDHLSEELRHAIACMAGKVSRWSLIYTDVEGLHEWRRATALAGAQYVRPVPWIRWSMPQLSGDRPPTGMEIVGLYWGSQKGRKSWNGPGNLTHLAHKCLRGEGKHKAEKPLDQALDLVEWFTRPGDHVLDPCAGAGTVGLACKILGRDYVGYEVSPKWADFAKARIAGPLSPRDEERFRRWQAARFVRGEKAEK